MTIRAQLNLIIKQDPLLPWLPHSLIILIRLAFLITFSRPLERPQGDRVAAYGSGLVQNHGYLDCNRRVAFMVMYVFLAINGWELLAPEAEVVTVMLDLAMGNLTESDLAQWLSERMSAIGCS